MLLGTLCWLLNNLLMGSPVAVLMEGLFLISNLVGYYRFHGRKVVLQKDWQNE